MENKEIQNACPVCDSVVINGPFIHCEKCGFNIIEPKKENKPKSN